MTRFIRWFGLAVVAASTVLLNAHAAEITLRLHQPLPLQANIPSLAIKPWIQKIESESGGRIKIQHFPAMQLGGRPSDLFDQAKDGVVDIVWIAPGYTPGRFPRTEVFELPFIGFKRAVPTSRAFYQFIRDYAMSEYQDVKLIAAHVTGPGVFHSKDPIRKLEDVKGMRVRAPSRMVNLILEQIGAVPVGMPITAVGEAISKGVVSAATAQWEVVPSLKLHQMVKNHTQFSGNFGLYEGSFVVVMNKARYEHLPDDLKKVIDANSGVETSILFARAMDQGDAASYEIIKKADNNIITLNEHETARWQQAIMPVREIWYREVSEKGIDGPALVRAAEDLLRNTPSGQ